MHKTAPENKVILVFRITQNINSVEAKKLFILLREKKFSKTSLK